MQTSRTLHSLALLAMGLAAPFFLTQCKIGAGSYRDVEYDPSMLKTPAGHDLEKKDYPFDDSGAYRKDWVKNEATGKTRSASALPVVAAAETTEGPGGSTPAASPGYARVSEARSAEVTGKIENIDSAGSSASISVTPPPAATSITAGAASYHTVVAGDTLYALSQRYRTSVGELKRVNGLADDSIQKGQTLRLP